MRRAGSAPPTARRRWALRLLKPSRVLGARLCQIGRHQGSSPKTIASVNFGMRTRLSQVADGRLAPAPGNRRDLREKLAGSGVGDKLSPPCSAAGAVQPRPLNSLFSDPANPRLNSSSPNVGGANVRNGNTNAASVPINSGACVRIAASMSAYP
jgi:hypothetical protein